MLPSLLVKGKIPNIDEIPINYIINRLKFLMPENGYNSAEINDRIFIIQAMTGSGKSTALPVEIFRILRNKNTPMNILYTGKSVLCTQPRILTALELAKEVSFANSPFNPDMILFKTVGYQTGPFTSQPYRGLIYATLGVLTAQLNNNTDEYIMQKYKFIILDEAHERNINADISLFLLYNFYKRNIGNKNLPFLLLTSATIDTEKYANYFSVSKNNIIIVEGQTYSIEKIYTKNDVSNVFTYIISVIKDICKTQDKFSQADVLVFLPGFKEIQKLQKELLNLNLDALIIALDADKIKNNSKEYTYVFAQRSALPLINGNFPNRRIILSTSVAETGLTIHTCKYVIDIGFYRSQESYPLYNISGLINRPATASRIIQRRGRVGRVFDGIFYGGYTEELFNSLQKQQYPEILTSYIEYSKNHLLLYRITNNFDLSKVNLLDFPPDESFMFANITATSLGYIDHTNSLTELGKIVSHFSYITMEQAKIIFSGFIYNVSILDLVTICSIMDISRSNLYDARDLFKDPIDITIVKNILPSYFKDANNPMYKLLINDELIEALLIFNAFANTIRVTEDIDLIVEWCTSNKIKHQELRNIFSIREDKINDLMVNGIDILYNIDKSLYIQPKDNYLATIINIKKCIYEGLRGNLLTYDSKNFCYRSLTGLIVSVESNLMSDIFYDSLKISKPDITQIHPKYLITDKFALTKKKNSQELLYTIKANYISVLDGYVYPDLSYAEPTIEYNIELTSKIQYEYRLMLYNLINKCILNTIKIPIYNI